MNAKGDYGVFIHVFLVQKVEKQNSKSAKGNTTISFLQKAATWLHVFMNNLPYDQWSLQWTMITKMKSKMEYQFRDTFKIQSWQYTVLLEVSHANTVTPMGSPEIVYFSV